MNAKTVFFKEMRELLRDRRVTIGAFLMPVLLLVLMMQMFGLVERGVKENRASKIVVVQPGETNPIVEGLKQLPGSEILTAASEQAAKSALEEGKARLALVFPTDFLKGLTSGEANITAFFDSSEPLSQVALRTVSVVIDETNKQIALKTIEASGLPPKTLETIDLKQTDTAKQQSDSAQMLLGLLPYMIVLWAFYGGFSAVSDMMAGEKERGTLETLLLSPVSRNDIVAGKLAALSLVCLLSSLSAVAGVALSSVISRSGTEVLKIDGQSFLAILALVLPLVAMFATVLFAVSTWAKNMREAQTYLTSVSFVVLMPAVFSNLIGFTGVDKAIWLRFVPILGPAVGLRDAFLGKPDWAMIAICAIVNLAIAAVLWVAIQRMVRRDSVLMRI